MAKDEEDIMSYFKANVSTRPTLVTYYEMDEAQVSSFNKQVMSVNRNIIPNAFPDFEGTSMDIEVFNISSSKEINHKGAKYFIEENKLKERMEEALKLSANPEDNINGKSYTETLEYQNHSHEFLIASLIRNIQKHKVSQSKYNPHGKKFTILAHYNQKVLSYKDVNGIEQWYKLGVDKKALSIIESELKDSVEYFILFYGTYSEAEVIPVKMIPSYLNNHTFPCEGFYPRQGTGTLYIGVSDVFNM